MTKQCNQCGEIAVPECYDGENEYCHACGSSDLSEV